MGLQVSDTFTTDRPDVAARPKCLAVQLVVIDYQAGLVQPRQTTSIGAIAGDPPDQLTDEDDV